MGLKEIRIHCRKCISRVVIVALSAQPPGVNKLCVCVHFFIAALESLFIFDSYSLVVSYVSANTISLKPKFAVCSCTISYLTLPAQE
jgi:hypothetical protein